MRHLTRAPSARDASASASTLKFVLLVFVLAIPFWLVGAVAGQRLLPGLPVVYALIAFCPLLAAVIRVRQEHGSVRALLARTLDSWRIGWNWWYVPVVLLAPAVSITSYAILRATHAPLPESPHVPLLAAPVLFLGFLLGAVGEELGWTGYATDRLRERWNPFQTGLILGVAWAAWHVPQLVQIGRAASWIGWWCAGTVASRIVIVWIYERTGRSTFAAIVFHAVQNLCWQLFPNRSSHWDPRLNALLLTCVVVVITLLRQMQGSRSVLGRRPS